MMSNRKVALYIAMSLDGYIAKHDDDISFLNVVDQEGEDYGYSTFSPTIDTYIVGRKTYEVVVGMVGNFPQAKDFDCYVVTRSARENEHGVTFYQGDPGALVRELKSKPGKNIYCDGGAEIIQALLRENLVDIYIVSVIPYILGDGIRLFKGGTPEHQLTLVGSKQFSSGLVQLHYEKKSPDGES